ncbi:phage neck terminator protein [Paraburkholderia sp. RL18-085-BIA-A]|uniref:phage neck terminator protein n=1 Tax=Paraburkholderia sp. RL18-085-BIA-A TaxID=3031633 RepID=UPI0038B9E913
MSATLSLTESQTLTALRSFLLSVLPAGTEVVKGQDNRVSEPVGPNFVTMTPLLKSRLSTNVNTAQDCAFNGAISGNTLTVSSMILGAIALNATLFGPNVLVGTTITGNVTGNGGVGTYTVSPAQTVAQQVMACGTQTMLQATKVTVQIDVHGPNSSDNAQIITTAFRDSYATDFFQSTGYDVSPLYADDARQMPFLNGEQQIEERWSIDAVLQTNPVLTLPQQYASELNVNIIDVDATYPA